MRLSSLVTWLFAAAVVLAGRTAVAEPIGIAVFSETYTTSVFAEASPGGASLLAHGGRTITAATPTSDYVATTLGGYAQAVTNPFSVLADADANEWPRGWLHSATAGATSVVEFSPTVDGGASLALELIQTGSPAYTEVVLNLLNLSTNQLVWDVGWSYGDTDEWLAYRKRFWDAAPTLETALSSTDVYRLTLSTRTGAMGDSQRVSLQVSGLQRVPVPEPAALSMFAVGAFAVLVRKARRRRAREPQVPPVVKAL